MLREKALRNHQSFEEACGGNGLQEGEVLCWKFEISMEMHSLCNSRQQRSFSLSPSTYPIHKGRTVLKKHTPGIFPGKEDQNNYNPILKEDVQNQAMLRVSLNLWWRSRVLTQPIWWSALRRTRKISWPPISHDPTANCLTTGSTSGGPAVCYIKISLYLHTKSETWEELLFSWRVRKKM